MITAVRANKKDMASICFSSFFHQTPLQLSPQLSLLFFVQLPLSRPRPITSSPTGLFGVTFSHIRRKKRGLAHFPPGLFERGGPYFSPSRASRKKKLHVNTARGLRAKLLSAAADLARQGKQIGGPRIQRGLIKAASIRFRKLSTDDVARKRSRLILIRHALSRETTVNWRRKDEEGL